MKQDNHIDDWMKDKLKGHPSILPEGGWAGLEESRESKKKRGLLFWWLTGFGSAAAVLGLVVFLTYPSAQQPSLATEDEKSGVAPQDEVYDTQEEQSINSPAQVLAAEDEKEELVAEELAAISTQTQREEEGSAERTPPFLVAAHPKKKPSSVETKDVWSLLPLHAEELPLLTIQQDTIQIPKATPQEPHWEQSWAFGLSYGFANLNPSKSIDQEFIGVSSLNHDDVIENSNFRLHAFGVSAASTWKKQRWAYSCGMELTRQFSQNSYAYNSPDSFINQSQDIESLDGGLKSNPPGFWTIGMPLNVHYYALPRLFVTGGITPQINFGAKGNWLSRVDFMPNTLRVSQPELGVPVLNLQGNLGLGFQFNRCLDMRYEIGNYLLSRFDVEGYKYRGLTHRIQLNILLPGS